jgi:hypothetical protein
MEDLKVNMGTCPRCGDEACSDNEMQGNHFYICFGCGFHTTNHNTKENIKTYKETLPQIYIDLEYKDDDGLYWYPYALNDEKLGMVFVEGLSVSDWSWNAVPLNEETNKPDMKLSKKYGKEDFIEALDYVGYFKEL